jgi:hypothetical protein
MQKSCHAPTCEYSKRWAKCVKPNAYNEALAWCKRNGIEHKKCKQDYNSTEAKKEACNKYEERMRLAGLGVQPVPKARQIRQRRQSTPKEVIVISSTSSTSSSSKKSSSSKPKSASMTPITVSSSSYRTPPDIPDSGSRHPVLSDAFEIPQRAFSSPTVKSFMQKRAANKIITFIKNNVLRRTENLVNRLNYYKSIQYYLRNAQYYNCLVPKRFQDINGNFNDGFELDTVLKLTKKIGTKSGFGVIYQTTARSNILSIATKLMPVNNKNKLEVILNTTVTQLVTNKISKHFLISYKTFKCKQRSYNLTLPPIIRGKEYYVTLNELAHGDLKNLCENPDFFRDDSVVFNVLIQCFLSIYTFHNLGYSHNDCHWGNFLFQISKNTNGYFHYIINGKNYYLKNVGYNMMIYDFGFAQNQNTFAHLRRVLEDYRRVLNAFRDVSNGGWVILPGLPSQRMSQFTEKLHRHIVDMITAFTTEDRAMKDVILPHFLKCPIPNIFVSALPAGETLANSTPFVINKQTLQIATVNPLSSPLV